MTDILRAVREYLAGTGEPPDRYDLADEILRLSSLHAQTRGLLEQATANRDAIAEERNRIMDSQLKEVAGLRANLASALRRLEILAFVIDEQQQQRMLPPCPHPDDAILGRNLGVAGALCAARLSGIYFCDGIMTWRPGCGRSMGPLGLWEDTI